MRLTSKNLLANLMKRLKKRTRVVEVFPNRASCDRLIGALLLEVHERWLVADHCYFNKDRSGYGALDRACMSSQYRRAAS
jgi:hypothetical protein